MDGTQENQEKVKVITLTVGRKRFIFKDSNSFTHAIDGIAEELGQDQKIKMTVVVKYMSQEDLDLLPDYSDVEEQDPLFREYDIAFMEAVAKANKEGKELMIAKRRRRPND